MTKIYIARHAESIANTQGIYQGQTYDTGLSELGLQQAVQLAGATVNLGIKRIICSPLMRTFETAMVCSKTLKIPIETNTQILETNHGKWEGKDKNWIIENYSQVYVIWQETPSKAIFPNGESFYDTEKRVRNFLLNNNWQEDTLIVTHDNIVRIILSIVKGDSFDNIWKYDLHPAAITTIVKLGSNGSTKFKIIDVNDTNHLHQCVSNISIHAL